MIIVWSALPQLHVAFVHSCVLSWQEHRCSMDQVWHTHTNIYTQWGVMAGHSWSSDVVTRWSPDHLTITCLLFVSCPLSLTLWTNHVFLCVMLCNMSSSSYVQMWKQGRMCWWTFGNVQVKITRHPLYISLLHVWMASAVVLCDIFTGFHCDF